MNDNLYYNYIYLSGLMWVALVMFLSVIFKSNFGNVDLSMQYLSGPCAIFCN